MILKIADSIRRKTVSCFRGLFFICIIYKQSSICYNKQVGRRDESMIEKTKRMMIVSFVILVSLCTCMIFAQSFFISKKNEETIGEMGELYIAETNRQILQKFASVTSIWTRRQKVLL